MFQTSNGSLKLRAPSYKLEAIKFIPDTAHRCGLQLQTCRLKLPPALIAGSRGYSTARI
jgi:hypothetical protein